MSPLFIQSTKPWVSAVGEIADAAGASGQTEQTTRAHRSLQAAFQRLNSFKWNWLQSEAPPLQVFAPFSVSATAASAVASAVVASGHGIQIDDLIVGSGFIAGNRVTATASASIGFQTAITGLTSTQSFTISATRDLYDLPADWKVAYDIRLLGTNRTLQPVHRRLWDRSVESEFTVSTPQFYETYLVGTRSKFRLIPAPAAADVVLRRYYRRMVPASASGVTGNLDIPEDYEPYVIAWAKWHYLVDKGNPEQAQTWMSLAQDGLKTMMGDQNSQPDEALLFLPGASMYGWPGKNDTRWVNWDY